MRGHSVVGFAGQHHILSLGDKAIVVLMHRPGALWVRDEEGAGSYHGKVLQVLFRDL